MEIKAIDYLVDGVTSTKLCWTDEEDGHKAHMWFTETKICRADLQKWEENRVWNENQKNHAPEWFNEKLLNFEQVIYRNSEWISDKELAEMVSKNTPAEIPAEKVVDNGHVRATYVPTLTTGSGHGTNIGERSSFSTNYAYVEIKWEMVAGTESNYNPLVVEYAQPWSETERPATAEEADMVCAVMRARFEE